MMSDANRRAAAVVDRVRSNWKDTPEISRPLSRQQRRAVERAAKKSATKALISRRRATAVRMARRRAHG